MHQIPRWGTLQRSPDPIAGFKERAEGKEGKGRGGERKGGEEM